MTNAEIERFRRIEAIFDKALDRPAGPPREAWVLEACGADAELYEAVASFLLDHEALSPLHQPPPEPMPRFGAWQAVRLLGRGGMGTVYLAERADGAFRMSAAVKVVPLALASPEIEERFRRERQFLASFDHPGIARLIDGGLTEHGIPYLVMELVDGPSIDRFCRERLADNRECAALFRQLMEALIYIHGRQVVHRDLKPSNVLVDGTGKVKLLDFGTATLTDAGGGDAITKSGVFALTPGYASPEQIAGGAATFASDIYSAGLVLQSTLPPGDNDKQLGLILSSALEAKPEDRYGSAAALDVDLGRYLAGLPVRASKASWRRWAIPALAIGLVTCLAIGTMFQPFHTTPESPSIAVLPFTNRSADPASQYLADGLAGEVADSLSHLKTLRVIARSSTIQFKGKAVDVREVGRLLHVANILEGSVERSGDRIKIATRLERASDRSILWSNTYERKASDLIAVQAELTAGIAGSLKVTAGISKGTHVPNAENHELVMKARYEAQQATPESMVRAEAYYQQAIEYDPEYAEAYSGLASAKFNELVARGSAGQAGERRSVEQMARKALALNPDMPAARALLATLAMQYDWDWAGAEREFRSACESSPSAAVEGQYAYLLLFRGRFAEADQHIQRLLELDPYSTVTMFNLSQYRMLERRYAEAREIAQRIAAQYPAMIPAQQTIARAYIEEGHTDLALKIYRPLESRLPQVRIQEAMAYAGAGRREEALRLIRPFEEKYPGPGLTAQWFALVYAPMGDEANTLKWLERSADQHEWQILSLGVNPVFAKLRNSPGFRAIEKRIGLGE